MSVQSFSVAQLLSLASAKIDAAKNLKNSSPALEARILFEHASARPRSWQIAHSDERLELAVISEFENLLAQRLTGKPIAFILGSQDFWSLNLAVSDCTLIPRQDTECLIEAALELDLPEDAGVIDLGTGTGAIALALATERANWKITGVDRIDEAVVLAKKNAKKHSLNVKFLTSNWLEALSESRFDLIVSNPPYVEKGSEYLLQGDLRFEPVSALCAGEDGLDDIRIIIEQSYDCLHSGAYLLLEHGYLQAKAIRQLLNEKGYVQISTKTDYNGLERVTQAQKGR